MLTGRQLREARKVLGMNQSVLAHKVGRITTAIMRAEEHEEGTNLSPEQEAAVRQTLERLASMSDLTA